jgi:hypothetical protein
MSLSLYLKKIMGLDLAEDYLWLSSKNITSLKSDSFIEGTKVIDGINNCNLILKPNANIEIKKVFHGKIIGLGNNIVRIRGEFFGTISCEKMIILEGGKVEANLWINKLALEKKSGFTLKGEMNGGEIISKPNFPDEIDFEYVNQLK